MLDESTANERLKRAFPAMRASFASVTPLPVEAMDAAFGILTTVTTDSDGPSSETVPAAYAEAQDLRFPAFNLQPQSALLKLMPSVLGLEAVRVQDAGEFARAYHLSAVNPERTRGLFNAEVAAWFARHPGLRLDSAGRGLLLRGPAWESFPRDAAEIFTKLAQAQRNAPPVSPQDPRAAAAAMPGFLGRQMRRELVTRADLSAFLAQPLPRKLPANIRLYCEKRSPQIWFGLGLIFAMVGAFFAYGFGRQGDWKGILFGSAFAAIGAPVAFFAGRSRWRWRRLLRRGELASARIERLEDSGWSSSTTGAVWNAYLRYSVRGQQHEATGTISGFGIERARNALEAGKPVSLLYDLADPQRVLLVEDLLNASPEYEP